MDALPQNTPDDLKAVYEEFDGLPEPFDERQHRTTSSFHDTFRDMVPVPEFTSSYLLQDAGPVTTVAQRATCPAYDNKSILHLAQIPRNHYADPLFSKNFVV